MNPEYKEKWTAALRSGDYQQGRRWLRKGDNFCCLGVLCDIVNPNGWRPSLDSGLFTFEDKDLGLPPTILAEVGLDDEFGKLPGGREDETLAEMNDAGVTFDQIADIIEKEF